MKPQLRSGFSVLTGFMALILAVPTMSLMPSSTASAQVTDEKVEEAIKKFKEWMYTKQVTNRDPVTEGWPIGENNSATATPEGKDGKNEGGYTSMGVLSLIVAGESMQDHRIINALNYLRKKPITGVYATAVRAHIWSYLPNEYMPLLQKDADWLMRCQEQHELGLFDYLQKYSKRIDHSVTQYGMLGLWQAGKRGIKVSPALWKHMRDHFIKQQHPDGGWSYSPAKGPTVTMTLAGLTALLIAQQEIYRQSKSPDPATVASIDKGMEWMHKNFTGSTSDYGWYCMERVALASGTRYFSGKDWFIAGASKMVGGPGGKGGGHGGAVPNNAFRLMFLSRGRVPVWINKISIPGKRWNEHPNDLYFLSKYLTELREGELNWQVIDINEKPKEWLQAPVSFLSSASDIELNDAQKKNVKTYIDNGGMLLCNPDNNNAYMLDAMKALANDLYPQYSFRQLDASHPLYYCLHQIDTKHKVWGLSNGARELMLVFEKDIGFEWQRDEKQTGALWDFSANLFSLITNKGVLENRLVPKFTVKKGGGGKGSFEVARGKYEGNWITEPAAWTKFGPALFNKTGLNIRVKDVNLSDLGNATQKLVHISGTAPYELKDSEISAIKTYVEGGGKILIETVGGKLGEGSFSESLESQLQKALAAPVGPLNMFDQVISGEGLKDGYDVSRVSWRWRTVQTLGLRPKPRLSAISVNDKPAIFFSHQDLTLGILGVKHWHILGYAPSSANQIMTNLVLLANNK